jgi:hypothetical protein
MDRRQISIALAPTPFSLGVAYLLSQQSFTMAHALAWLMIVGSLVWPLYAFYSGRRKPRVDDWPGHNSLDLRIVNGYEKLGLLDDQLTLLSISKWEQGSVRFSPLKIAPLVIYGNECGLPFGVPRMFRLLSFTDKAAPFIEASINGEATRIDLPSKGIWRFLMELRWSGGVMKISRCFHWDDDHLPTFCKEPSAKR